MSKRLTFKIIDLPHQRILSQQEAYIEMRPKFMRVKMVYEAQPIIDSDDDGDTLPPPVRHSWTTVIDRSCVKGYDVTRRADIRRWEVDINNANGQALIHLYFNRETKALKLVSELHKYIFLEDYIDIPIDEGIV